ncbi:hypothetical protein [Haloechinothrix halophila]|nr:hypothetical protein [Haloechinothrix halophila]
MSARLVHIARIPVLLVLFVAIGPAHGEAMDAVRRIDTGAYWGP